MKKYALADREWPTPRGAKARFQYRLATNDFNTIAACTEHDEYGIKGHVFEGPVLDVGAYVGGLAVALAVDNPNAQVVAIEPVPPNVALLRTNVGLNNLQDRVTILEAGVGPADRKTLEVVYGFEGTESSEHHAFVGNSDLVLRLDPDAKKERAQVPVVTLSDLVEEHGSFSFAKVDAEGGEWGFLDDPALEYVTMLVGEWHAYGSGGRNGHDLQKMLEKTHKVEVRNPSGGIGHFWAMRR